MIATYSSSSNAFLKGFRASATRKSVDGRWVENVNCDGVGKREFSADPKSCRRKDWMDAFGVALCATER